MKLWKNVSAFFFPTRENAYRPHLLHRGMLMFFIFVVLAAEGFMATSLVARQSSDTFLSAAQASISAPSSGSSFKSTTSRVLSRLLSSPQAPTDWTLAVIAAVLMCGVLFAFAIHVDVQSHEMLLGGMVIAAIALACLAANIRFLSNPTTASTAAVQNSVAR